MFKQLIKLTSQIFFLSKDTQQNKTAIKDVNSLRREVQDLARGFERLAYEIRRTSESEAQERKYPALQLENELLKFERRLPSNKTGEQEN